jgi:hypothetical protein
MSCIIITNYLINMWLSEYKGLFHLLLFPWLYIGPDFLSQRHISKLGSWKHIKLTKV